MNENDETRYCLHLSCRIETALELRLFASRLPARAHQLNHLADSVARSQGLIRCRHVPRRGMGGTGCDAPLAGDLK